MVNVKKVTGSVLIVGFMFGILYVNMFVSEYFYISGLFSQDYIYSFAEKEYIMTEFIGELIYRRLLPLVLFYLAKRIRFRRPMLLLIILWYAFIFGSYLSMGVMMYGVKGLFLCLFSVFPHILFYLVAYYLVFVYAYHVPIIKWNVSKSIVLILSILCGIVLECTINPAVLRWYIGVM